MRPPNIELSPDVTLGEYRGHRFYQAAYTKDTYRGRTIAKMPEDLRTYQHVIEETQPFTIVELGTYMGGSAMWFADQLRTLRQIKNGGQVITVDIAQRPEVEDDMVFMLTGDLKDLQRRVEMSTIGHRTMVVDDSAHTYESTMNALRLYGPLVTPGCYFVVEDGWVEDCGRAVDDFVQDNDEWERQDLAIYGVTSIPNGWLKRR